MIGKHIQERRGVEREEEECTGHDSPLQGRIFFTKGGYSQEERMVEKNNNNNQETRKQRTKRVLTGQQRRVYHKGRRGRKNGRVYRKE